MKMRKFLRIFLFFFSPKHISTNMKTQNLSLKWMLVRLCFSMLIFNNIFISGIENQTSRKCSNDTTRCYQQCLPHDATSHLTCDTVHPATASWRTAVAVLLHHFLLQRSCGQHSVLHCCTCAAQSHAAAACTLPPTHLGNRWGKV